MKSSIRKETFEKIYKMLDEVSPVDYDCGSLCNAICCTCDKDNTSDDYEFGIYLLPGEDKLFTKKEDWLIWNYEMAEDYEFPDSWSGKVWFIRCKNPPVCDRSLRSIQCRTYPLAPHFTNDGKFHLIYNSSILPYECPLISKKIKLNKDFIEKTFECWKILITDPLIADLVKLDSSYRNENEIEIMI